MTCGALAHSDLVRMGTAEVCIGCVVVKFFRLFIQLQLAYRVP